MITTQTKLRQSMRRVRGAYIENVRAGRCKMDPKLLREFDTHLERLDGRAQAVPTKR